MTLALDSVIFEITKPIAPRNVVHSVQLSLVHTCEISTSISISIGTKNIFLFLMPALMLNSLVLCLIHKWETA